MGSVEIMSPAKTVTTKPPISLEEEWNALESLPRSRSGATRELNCSCDGKRDRAASCSLAFAARGVAARLGA